MTELGFVKMLAIVLGRTLSDSEIGCHNIGYACYRLMRHCDRYALALGGFILLLEFFCHLVILPIIGYMPGIFAAYYAIW